MSGSKRNDRSMAKTATFELNARARRERREAARKRSRRLLQAVEYEDGSRAARRK